MADRVAAFLRKLALPKGASDFGKKNAGLTIAISGDASPLGQQKLKDAKIALATRIAPRPLR